MAVCAIKLYIPDYILMENNPSSYPNVIQKIPPYHSSPEKAYTWGEDVSTTSSRLNKKRNEFSIWQQGGGTLPTLLPSLVQVIGPRIDHISAHGLEVDFIPCC